MWYIFPQIKGLGHSETSEYYVIKDKCEAEAYLQHPVLGKSLLEISGELLKLKSCDARRVMGFPDDMKLKSFMTLFAAISNDTMFQQVLDKFFDGQQDDFTKRAIRER